MKKFFTLLFVAVVAIAAKATDYNVPITISVNGVSVDQTGVVTVVKNKGLYNLTMKNFMLQGADGPMPVGNVELKGIKPIQDGNATLLITSQNVKITAGDTPGVSFWMGPNLPDVPINLRGKIEGNSLRCYIDIDMTETLGQVINVAIGNGYQIANASFESWHTSKDSYVEPNAWHSFESGTGSLVGSAGNHISKSSDAHSGDACARVFSTEMNFIFFKIIANGTMTTGRMNAGSASPADKSNHAYIDLSSTEKDGNGDLFYTPMCSRPDSIAVWVKFKQGTANASHPYATISAVIISGVGRYQDPEDQAYTNVVAKANNNKITQTNGEWVRVSVPFVYTENTADPKALLVTLSTNADAGQGSGSDELLVDDISLIYNAKVTALKIKGRNISRFTPSKTNYEMELNEEITASDIEVTVDGKTAYVVKEVEVDGAYYVCTIKVLNADMSTMSQYVVKVKSTATGISSLNPVASHQTTYFTLDGRQAKTLVPGQVYICRQADGTTIKVIR